MTEELLGHISRRGTRIGIASAIIVSGLGIGCDFAPTIPVTSKASTASSAISKPILSDVSAKMQKYYPELSASGVSLNSIDELSTAVPTNIYNFTNARLDREVLNYIYQYFEGSIQSGERPYKQSYSMGNANYDLNMAPRIGITERNVFFIPTNAARPAWAIQKGLGTSRAATGIMEDNTTMTFAYSFPTESSIGKEGINIANTFAFSTEACQSVVQVKTYDSQGQLAVDRLKRTAAQEIVCNGEGFALAEGLNNISYERFRQVVDTTPVFQSYATIPVKEDTYNGIKSLALGSVIKP